MCDCDDEEEVKQSIKDRFLLFISYPLNKIRQFIYSIKAYRRERGYILARLAQIMSSEDRLLTHIRLLEKDVVSILSFISRYSKYQGDAPIDESANKRIEEYNSNG